MRSDDIKLVALCGEMTLRRCPKCGELKEESAYQENSSWCYTCRKDYCHTLYASLKKNDKQTAAELRKERYRRDELYRLTIISNAKKRYPSYRKKHIKDSSHRYYMEKHGCRTKEKYQKKLQPIRQLRECLQFENLWIKKCTRCGEYKLYNDFYRRQGMCKVCANKNKRMWLNSLSAERREEVRLKTNAAERIRYWKKRNNQNINNHDGK